MQIRLVVLEKNDKTDLRQLFFSEFRRKHLFITIYIETQCTRPLNRIKNEASGGVEQISNMLESTRSYGG